MLRLLAWTTTPYIGLLIFLVPPGLFVFGLLLIPLWRMAEATKTTATRGAAGELSSHRGDKILVTPATRTTRKTPPRPTGCSLRSADATWWQRSVGIHGRHLADAARIRYISTEPPAPDYPGGVLHRR